MVIRLTRNSDEPQSQRIVYPFTAIVGMEKAKLALLAISVNPLIGGVLLRGDKGTGKTTLVRGLASVLPEIEVVADCPFNCNPRNPLEMCDNCYRRWVNGEELPIMKKKMKVVDLPLSVTPDRLIGTIDIEKAIKEGVRILKPGILAEANRNILYIDEVNLLDDYIADLILDAAAYGWNIIEREHVSFKHPSRFILIGSMNPEEGELRPQLLDRFGLVVNVEAPMDPDLRAEIVRRVEEYSLDPYSFYKKYEASEKQLREKIVNARRILPKVTIDDDLLKMLTKTLVEMKIKTCRAEITTIRTAKALAALDGRTSVTLDDLKKAMELALPHRLSLKPFEKPGLDNNMFGNRSETEQDRNFRQKPGNHEHRQSANKGLGNNPASGMNAGDKNDLSSIGNSSIVIPPSHESINLPNNTSLKKVSENCLFQRGSRYAYATVINEPIGIPISYVYPAKNPVDIDIIGTITNIASNKVDPRTLIKHGMLEEILAVRIRRKRIPILTIIALDSSGSMNVLKRIAVSKKIAQEIIEKSYSKRTWVSLITFRSQGIDLFVPMTRNYWKIMELISKVPTGGKTPLAAGLKKIVETTKMFRTKYRNAHVIAMLITDGKANTPLNGNIEDEIKYYSKLIAEENIELVIIDTRPHGITPSISYINKISSITGAKVYRI